MSVLVAGGPLVAVGLWGAWRSGPGVWPTARDGVGA